MEKSKEIKEEVKSRYTKIVSGKNEGCGCIPSSCCGPVQIDGISLTTMNESYDNIEGHVPEADYQLGCGIPTEFANINLGDVVVDLGSGAGNDVFVARSFVGEFGKVIGIDMTEAMFRKAEENKAKLGFRNVEFYHGEIENIPLENNIADKVISNCVLNLVPSKQKAFQEIYRILKPNGMFCVSDIVLEGTLSDKILNSKELYTGCIAGAIQQEEYLRIIESVGFKEVTVRKVKEISLSDDFLLLYLNEEELADYRMQNPKIRSITVTGIKN